MEDGKGKKERKKQGWGWCALTFFSRLIDSIFIITSGDLCDSDARVRVQFFLFPAFIFSRGCVPSTVDTCCSRGGTGLEEKVEGSEISRCTRGIEYKGCVGVPLLILPVTLFLKGCRGSITRLWWKRKWLNGESACSNKKKKNKPLLTN